MRLIRNATLEAFDIVGIGMILGVVLFTILGGSAKGAEDNPFKVQPAFEVKADPSPPPATAKKAKPLCSCDDCKCEPGECPGKCPVKAAKSTPGSPRDSVVYISVDNGDGTSDGGTGTVIASENGRSLILTNAHVVESGAHPISVTYWREGSSWKCPATYIGGTAVTHVRPGEIRTEGPDLALIELPMALPAVSIADAIPEPGTAVSLYGFGGADAYGVTPLHKTGKVIGDAGFLSPREATLVTIKTVNGDSGAAVLNDAGELVGVHRGGSAAAVAVRLDQVHTFTVTTIQTKSKRVLFPKFHDALASRKIAKAAAAKASVSPSAGGCANGQCPAPGRVGIFGRRR